MLGEAQSRKRTHPCPHCLAKFPSLSKRDRHARAVHDKWRDYKCPHCSSSRRSPAALHNVSEFAPDFSATDVHHNHLAAHLRREKMRRTFELEQPPAESTPC